MRSFNFDTLSNSKIKTYNILSKTFIVVFILVNLFNFLPIDLTNQDGLIIFLYYLLIAFQFYYLDYG